MIVKGINHESLYIDDCQGGEEGIKAAIFQKYGIPIDSQHIVFNGKHYVLGIFDPPLVPAAPNTCSNPLGAFGCSDTLFNALESSGMTIDQIRASVFPHKEEQKQEEAPDQPVIVNAEAMATRLSTSQYKELGEMSLSLAKDEKAAIMKGPSEYICLILRAMGTLKAFPPYTLGLSSDEIASDTIASCDNPPGAFSQ